MGKERKKGWGEIRRKTNFWEGKREKRTARDQDLTRGRDWVSGI